MAIKNNLESFPDSWTPAGKGVEHKVKKIRLVHVPYRKRNEWQQPNDVAAAELSVRLDLTCQ